MLGTMLVLLFATMPAEKFSEGQTLYVTCWFQYMQLQSQPSWESSTLEKLKCNKDEVTFVQTLDGWSLVRHHEKSGYVPVSYLSASKNEQNSTFTVRGLAYRVIPHESTSYYRTLGYAHTSCYGSGAYFGYMVDLNAYCSTFTIPSENIPFTVRSTEIVNQVESEDGMVYTITCTANWVGSNCSWLNPGSIFGFEIKGTTAWITGTRGGNMGKEVRAKFEVLDIRPKN